MLSECLILLPGFTAGKFRLWNYKILLRFNSKVFLCSELAQGFSVVSVKLNFVTLKMRCESQGFYGLARRRMRRIERERRIGVGQGSGREHLRDWSWSSRCQRHNGGRCGWACWQCLNLFPPVVTNPSIMIPPLATVTANLSLQSFDISKVGIKPETMLMTYLTLYQLDIWS